MNKIATKILITGSNGLLGQKLVSLCKKKKIEFLATSKGKNRNENLSELDFVELDICSKQQIDKVIDAFKPDYLIHTAAITNVDYCELNPDECDKTNRIASSILFDACKKRKIHFQLLSTDFVFDGQKGNYKENDKPNPLSIYAKSKVDAENVLLKSDYLNYSIVRTIIVYGQGSNLSRSNIVCWAKDALSKGDQMNIVFDQFRAPTWASDLAWACLRICELNKTGIYHICGPQIMSVFEIVERIANHFKFSVASLKKISSKTLSQPAQRPPKTGFDLSKSQKDLGYNPKTLEETLDLLN
ncbi:MAG: SDR family oxidoreductase [Crocinitomicaceae bacterium]|nr:SDR family oxidoreductase [Crocinitomicaceae bacterium]